MNIAWPTGIGAVLAIIALVIIVALLAVQQLTFLPLGVILLLLALSRML